MNGEETTLSMAMNDAAEKGYKNEFKIENGSAVLDGSNYTADQLTIVKHYRFEGDSNPDDMSVLYLLETNDGKKGIIVDAYGAYSAEELGLFIKNVNVRENE